MKFYRINVSGQKFFLSRKNIESDGPNVFTEKFDKEPRATRMAFDRNPILFAHVHRHLQGYEVITDEMTMNDIENMILDARFYRLMDLENKLYSKKNTLIYFETSFPDCVERNDEYKRLLDNVESDEEMDTDMDTDMETDINEVGKDEEIGGDLSDLSMSSYQNWLMVKKND